MRFVLAAAAAPLVLLSTLALTGAASAQDDAGTPDDTATPVDADPTDDALTIVVEGSPLDAARKAIVRDLAGLGYEEKKRKGDKTTFYSDTVWHPMVEFYDDGRVLVKRRNLHLGCPTKGDPDDCQPQDYLWCLILPTGCIKTGGLTVEKRKLGPRKARVLAAIEGSVNHYEDVFAAQSTQTYIETMLPTRLQAMWDGSWWVEPPTRVERRASLAEFWLSRTETPEGDAVRLMIGEFLADVVMASDAPYTAEEVARIEGLVTHQGSFAVAIGHPQLAPAAGTSTPGE